MSWISGLADKAEKALNKLDQNAANALQQPEGFEENLRRSISSTFSPKKSSNTSKLTSIGSPYTNQSQSSDISSSFKKEISEASLASKPAQDETSSSRRSSVSSKADSVIDIDNVESGFGKHAKFYVGKQTNAVDSVQELTAFKIALAEVTSERDELRLRLTALNRDVENAGLKQRAHELESLVQRLTEERDQALKEKHDAIVANSEYVHSVSELEANLAKLQQEYLETAQKLQMQLRETAQQRQELQDYRNKAQIALSMKDNLIKELKAKGKENTEADLEQESGKEIKNSEMSVLQMELKHAVEEKETLNEQLKQSREDLEELSRRNMEQIETLRENEAALRQELRLERERNLATESEQRMRVQELSNLIQQQSNQLGAMSTRMQDKERQVKLLMAEIEGRRQCSSNESNLSFGDLEARIKTLTQTLVDKQSTVEKITAEKNALRIQIEKLQEQLQNLTYQSVTRSLEANVTNNALLSNSTDDAKAQYPLLMAPSPFDNHVARRVKRAYSSLDSAGIRLGAFLRRYPLMRILVLMYVALLHLWVMFVLLSYTPN